MDNFFDAVSMAASPIVLFSSVLIISTLLFIIWRSSNKQACEANAILLEVNRIVAADNLKAEFIYGESGVVRSVAVKGDGRAHQLVICLKGSRASHERLDELSREITNRLPVSRVLFELTAKK